MIELHIRNAKMGEPRGAFNSGTALTTSASEAHMADPIQDLPGEIWKPVVGWEKLYAVSSMGRVRSLGRASRNRNGATYIKPRILTPYMGGKYGHGYCDLQDKPRCARRFVHVMVLEAFVGPRPHGMECCHNDGNARNNRLENLRWDTPANNARDKKAHGTYVCGERQNGAKLTRHHVLAIRTAPAQLRSSDMARTFGVSPSLVSTIRKGQRWRCVS